MFVRASIVLLAAGTIFSGLWLMWPSPINPVYWDEPELPPLEDALGPNAAIQDADFFPMGGPGSARCLALDKDGDVYFGNMTGEIMRLAPPFEEGSARAIADFGPVPVLDLDWINATTLGATTPDGIFAVDTLTGETTRISAGVPGHVFGYANDLAVAQDGQIYFTDSSILLGTGDNRQAFYFDMLENRPHGALYVWDPQTQTTRLAADRLYFPNGVAIASDGKSVFIAETFRYRVLRHWVAGPLAGETEVFAANLPGVPDSLTTDASGRLFVGLPAQRSATLRQIRRRPWLARIVARFPEWLRPAFNTPPALVAVFDQSSGELIGSLHDPDGEACHISGIASANSQDLWFGSSDCGYLARLRSDRLEASLSPGEAGQDESGQ